ncbi:MAG: universal stress protein [Betaproteobacteria bacterium]|nr:universal stress protein [Betaproteobacteria bacterium]
MSQGGIAVAVDGSQASDGALDYALGLARTEGRSVTGVFVLDTGWADFIGNDWQSAAGARQGFLDYIRGQLEVQAEAARAQFAGAAADVPNASFSVIPGDPLEALVSIMAAGEADVLVAGAQVFQVCGRPSLKRLARNLVKRVKQQVVII